MSEQVKARDLHLADIIRVPSSSAEIDMPWNTAIVREVTATEVKLFRPYGTTANFSYSGGVICYVGIENYSIPRNDLLYTVLEGKELK